jgi:transposase
MAMGTRKQRERQEDFWVAHTEIASVPSHPFYRRLNELLEGEKFDEFVEGRCAKFYARKYGRPSLTPGIYFRSLLIGYFEGIDSERGIAWRLADSLALRQFVAIGLDENTPDHSTISRSRRLIDLETHREVFAWVLALLADRGLIKGKRIGIDATTLEANAAMRSIVQRDTGESYDEFLCGLAKASGIATPTREDLVRLDRKRKKRSSNKEWKSPADGDARIAKMKDGRTHLAHKAEHAVDLDTGAVVAATLQGADQGDTKTLDETLSEAGMAVAEQVEREVEFAAPGKAQGERGWDRRDGCGQGVSQWPGDAADEGVLGAQLHSAEETEGATALEGQAGGATSGVCKSAACAWRVRQESTAAAGRVSRAQLRALLRDGRDATLPSARTQKHSKAATDPCGRVQSEPDPAQVTGRGHTEGVEEPRWHIHFVCLFAAHAPGKSEWAPAKPIGNISDKIFCGITKANTPLAVPQTRHFHHGLLDTPTMFGSIGLSSSVLSVPLV